MHKQTRRKGNANNSNYANYDFSFIDSKISYKLFDQVLHA